MRIALTNCGHRLALRLRDGAADALPDLDPALREVIRLLDSPLAPVTEGPV